MINQIFKFHPYLFKNIELSKTINHYSLSMSFINSVGNIFKGFIKTSDPPNNYAIAGSFGAGSFLTSLFNNFFSQKVPNIKPHEAVAIPIKDLKPNIIGDVGQTVKIAGFIFIGLVIIEGVRYVLFKKDQEPSQAQKAGLSEDDLSDMSVITLTSNQVKLFQEKYSCPLTSQLMEEPVLAVCKGCKYPRNYEKLMIEEWIQKKQNCPFCQQSLNIEDLHPNQALKPGIKMFKKQIRKFQKMKAQQRIENDGLQNF